MSMVASAGRVASMDVTSRLEASTLAKVQAACNFVNAETDRVRNQTIGIAVMCGLGAFVLSSLTGLGDARVPLVLAAGISIFFVVRARTELATSFRSIAAKRIVAGLGRELTYHAGSSLTRRHFAAMDLFADHCERWRSSDEIAGRIQGVKYSLHRVTASGSDRRQPPIFQGVIIKIDFDDAFPAHTVVVPDNNGLLTFAPKGAIGSGRKKDLVMMKNPAFERMFSVHSTDYYEARQLVTPWFMKLVMEAQATLGTELRLCFLQRSLYVTVAGDTLRFRPALFSEPLTPQAAVGMLVHLVAFAQRLAEIRGSS